jgi:hypothetical protein
MKKLMLAAALTLLPVAGLAQSGFEGEQPTLAQADGPRAHGKRGKRGHRGKHKIRILMKSLKDVGVSDATLEKIKAELKAQKPAMKKLHEDAKAARKTGDPILIQEARLKIAEKKLEMTTDVRKYVTAKQWTAAIGKLKERRKAHMQKRMERMQSQMDDL